MHKHMTRKGSMPLHKTIDLLYHLAPQAREICPFGMQEPMLDPNLSQVLANCKLFNPRVNTCIFTNMSVYPEDHIKKIFRAGLLDKLVISFYGVDKETYNLLQPPLNYEQTIANIKRIVKYKHQLRWNTPRIFLEVLITPETAPKISEFTRKWEGIVDKVGYSPLNSWNGTVKVDYDLMERFLGKSAQRVPCFRPFTSLNVHFDGSATMCCMDCNDDYVVGNVFEDWDVWRNSQKLQEIQRLHAEGKWDEISLCRECSAWRYNFPSEWVKACLNKPLPAVSVAKQ